MSRSNLANIEKGTVRLTDRVKHVILKEFHVNEEWFNTGLGNIFIDITDQVMHTLKDQHQLDDIDIQTIKNFLKLSDKKRKQVLGYIDRLLQE